jgi:hypothetical protein
VTAPVDQQTQAQPTASTAAMMAAYLAATAALRSRLLAFTAANFAGQGDYRDAAADAFVAAMVPLVQASQQTMASLTSAYLAHLTSATAGGSAAPVGIPLETVSNLRGVDPAEVYRRPYVQVWTDLSQSKDFPTAVAAGARRAQSLAATDLQLAKTHAAQRVMQHDGRITGYRRVLTGPHSCALCVLASTRWYSRGDLSPIHNNCDCAVAPLFGGARPDEMSAEELHAVIARDLGDKYVSASGTQGPVDYHKILVTHDHGELGPVLGVRGQHFLGPSDIPGG